MYAFPELYVPFAVNKKAKEVVFLHWCCGIFMDSSPWLYALVAIGISGGSLSQNDFPIPATVHQYKPSH